MVTTTTSPRCARLVPSLSGDDPEPVAKPPPWHQNITRRLRSLLAAGPTAGVQTLSTRQSSPSAGRFSPEMVRPPAGGGRAAESRCGALCPYASASRTPDQSAVSAGGMKRFGPAVLAPYGMPLKILMPLWSTPRILPRFVSAMTNSASCARTPSRKRLPETVRAAKCFNNSRRENEETHKVGGITVSLRAILSLESIHLEPCRRMDYWNQ